MEGGRVIPFPFLLHFRSPPFFTFLLPSTMLLPSSLLVLLLIVQHAWGNHYLSLSHLFLSFQDGFPVLTIAILEVLGVLCSCCCRLSTLPSRSTAGRARRAVWIHWDQVRSHPLSGVRKAVDHFFINSIFFFAHSNNSFFHSVR